MLDPRISYEGLKQDYAENPDLLQYLENTTMDLRHHYKVHYAGYTVDSAVQRTAQQTHVRSRSVSGCGLHC